MAYKMAIDSSTEGERIFLFRGPGCRRKMLLWYKDYRIKAASEAIARIRVWGTVGNKTTLILEWRQP